MNTGNKIVAGVLFAASVGVAVKAIFDIRALKKEEEEIFEMAEEVFDDESSDESKDKK